MSIATFLRTPLFYRTPPVAAFAYERNGDHASFSGIMKGKGSSLITGSKFLET